MKYSITKHYPRSVTPYPMLDGRLRDNDEKMTVEIQQRPNNHHMLYVHIDGVTIVRLLADNVHIVDDAI